MGDQDVNLSYEEIINNLNKFGIKYNQELFALAKTILQDQGFLAQFYGKL